MLKKQSLKIDATKIFVILLTIALLFILLFPFLVMISTMLKTAEETYDSPPTWLPKDFYLGNFLDVFNGEGIPLINYLRNSSIIALGAVLLNSLISIPAGYAIARLRFTGKKTILYSFLVIQMFSPVIVIIALFKIVRQLGLIDSFLGLILANTIFTVPFTIWMLNGYFSSIPIEIEEAARIDGCTRIGALLRIIIPIAAPGLVTTTIYTFIYAWNEFLFAFTFIQSNDKTPITTGLYAYVGRFLVNWELLLTAAFIALLPVLILFYLIEKRLVKGLAGGAVKG